jgi:hypothetical protein
MMKNMKPVPAQDRPKVIAVSVALVVAVGFLGRNLMGTGALAQSNEPGQAAASAPAVNTAPEPASALGSVPEPSAAADIPGKPAGFGDVGQIALNDPFHPVAAIKIAEAPAAPTPARPAAPAMTPAARRPAPVLPALEVEAATADRTMPTEPEARPAAPAADTALAGARPADGHPNELPEAPTVPTTLTGTVGSGIRAVATFRAGEETVFARPQQVVAGWRVVRIEVGQVLLSHHNRRQLVLVGNSLPGSPRLADRGAVAPAG